MYEASINTLTENEISSTFAKEMMLPLLQAILKFSFEDIKPSVDIYAIFQLESVHCFSLEVGKMPKECTIVILGDETRITLQ